MDIKKVLFIVLFQGMLNFAVFAAEKHSTPSRSAFLTTQENKVLIGHVVKRFESPSQMSCSHSCLRNSWCTSTNFMVPSDKNSKGTCELNKHSSIDTSTEVHDQRGVTFSMMLKECLMTGCLHGGPCVLDERKESFSCSCKGLWTGGNCELAKIGRIKAMGCYKDEAFERALPEELYNYRSSGSINWTDVSGSVIEKCKQKAIEKGYECFAIQFYGLCWSGKNACDNYGIHGESDECFCSGSNFTKYDPKMPCIGGIGGMFTNFVYKID